MNPFWSQSMQSSWVSRSVQSAGSPPMSWTSGRTCTHQCRCREGTPCQCAGSCHAAAAPRARQSWRLPPPTAQATFADAGIQGEFGRFRRGGYGAAPRARFSGGYGYRSRAGAGGGFRRGWGSPYQLSTNQRWSAMPYQPAALQRSPSFSSVQRQRARRITRAQRLNHHYARRIGWGRHARQIAARLGSSTPTPWSLPFVRAVARWQRGVGFPVTGVITPDVWARLRASLTDDQFTTRPPEQFPPMTAPGQMPPDQMPPMPMPGPGMADEPMSAAPPSSGMEPMDQPDAAPPDGGADSGPGDAAPADAGAPDAGGANEWGWSARW